MDWFDDILGSDEEVIDTYQPPAGAARRRRTRSRSRSPRSKRTVSKSKRGARMAGVVCMPVFADRKSPVARRRSRGRRSPKAYRRRR